MTTATASRGYLLSDVATGNKPVDGVLAKMLAEAEGRPGWQSVIGRALQKEAERGKPYSLATAVKMSHPDSKRTGFEAEISAEIGRHSAREARGLFVPHAALFGLNPTSMSWAAK